MAVLLRPDTRLESALLPSAVLPLPKSPSTIGAAGPVAPVAPVAPAMPVAPVGPVGPVAPSVPLIPFVPAVPVGPVAPVAPVGLFHLFRWSHPSPALRLHRSSQWPLPRKAMSSQRLPLAHCSYLVVSQSKRNRDNSPRQCRRMRPRHPKVL